MDLGVVGAGRVGTALAVLLARAGHRIAGVSGRTGTAERAARHLPAVEVLPALDVCRRSEVVLIGTPDDRIAGVCSDLAAQGAFRAGQAVVHLSGAAELDVLAAAGGAGAGVLSVHPLQTFPTVESAIERLPGSGMAVTARDDEGYGLGESLARDVGGLPFRLAEEARPLYHAAAVFASNYVVALEALAATLFAESGIEDPVPLFMPLSRASLENVASLGPAAALTGPAARGDAGTVRRNLEALEARAPEAVAAYVALADTALHLAERSGRLNPRGASTVREVLDRWR